MSGHPQQSPEDVADDPTPRIGVGDLVRTSANSHPQFKVIAIAGDRAWLREVQHGTDHVVPAAQCRRAGASHN